MEAQRTTALVLKTAVDLVHWDEALVRLLELGKARKSSVVCICNVHMTVTANSHPELAKVLSEAEMVTPDGAPIAWALRRAGFSTQQRINGPDLMWRYLALAERERQIVSFYGGTEETMRRLRQTMKESFPKLRVGTMLMPPFRPLTPEEDAEAIEAIHKVGTNLLFVGLGCPKQEVWMGEHKGRLHAVMVGVGAAFDYHAGTLKRAPVWMQNAGLEWFHRLVSEPRRLWRRYLVTNTQFIGGMAKTGFRATRFDNTQLGDTQYGDTGLGNK